MIDQNDKNQIAKMIDDALTARAKDNRYRNTYVNTTHNGLDGPVLGYVPLTQGFLCVGVTTNGATAVNSFTTFGSPFNMTIMGVFLISQDTTAGNITLKEAGNTVVVIAKGTVAGTMVGGVSLANTTVRRGDAVTVVSSSAGNATVFLVFKVNS